MKWMLIIALPILLLIILFLIGRKSVHAEIIIDANPAKVWKVLMEKTSYREWNSVLIPIKGDLVEGSSVTYEFFQDAKNKSVISSKVKKIKENTLLNQGGGIPGILTFNHKYILERSGNGTKVTIHEDYRGMGVPFWNPAAVQKAYESLCNDLKKRVESIK
jgi:hypothetical protein